MEVLRRENSNEWLTKCMMLWMQKYYLEISPWPWWTILLSNRYISRKEAQASFPLPSWSAPYQLKHSCIPHSMLINIYRISSQTLDNSTWIISKHGLYLICPEIEAIGTLCWSLVKITFVIESFIDWIGYVLSPLLKVEERWYTVLRELRMGR